MRGSDPNSTQRQNSLLPRTRTPLGGARGTGLRTTERLRKQSWCWSRSPLVTLVARTQLSLLKPNINIIHGTYSLRIF